MKPKPEIINDICIPRDIVLQAAMFRLGNLEEEVQAGYNIIRKYHKTVTIFGSARSKEESADYQTAMRLGEKLAKEGYTIITGGGGGIMEAANRGAREAGGASIGFNIALPHEQTLNSYTTESLAFTHFAPRKIVMTLYADAYIYFPGGFGTMDELTEILTLIQTGKTQKAPIILFGSEFWNALNVFVKKYMLEDRGTISSDDATLYTITDDIEEALKIVKSNKTYCEH